MSTDSKDVQLPAEKYGADCVNWKVCHSFISITATSNADAEKQLIAAGWRRFGSKREWYCEKCAKTRRQLAGMHFPKQEPKRVVSPYVRKELKNLARRERRAAEAEAAAAAADQQPDETDQQQTAAGEME